MNQRPIGAFYTQRRSKFGIGMPAKGRRKAIRVGSMLAKPLPNTPLPP
jgi:hypothetical protein